MQHRLKKHVASKIAESMIGRKIIHQHVGTEGNELVDALKQAAARHTSKEKAKSLNQLLCKMVFKTKFMVERGEITHTHASLLAQALAELGVEILHTLKPEHKEEPSVDALLDKMKVAHDATMELISPHLTAKNKDLLDTLLSFYDHRDFVTAIVTDPEFEAEKGKLYENVQVLVGLTDDPTTQLDHQLVLSVPLFSDKYSSVISAVKTFWNTVASQNQAELVHKLYQNLFETNPEYASIFKNTVEEREEQLLNMLNCTISRLDNFEMMIEEIRKLGHKHVAWGVPLAGFEQMWKALDAALYELFGLKYHKQVRKSMEFVFHHLMDIMRTCYPPDTGDESKVDAEAFKNVQAFWKGVQKEQDQVSHSLYETLFSQHPEYESLFTGDVDELDDKVMAMFSRVVSGLDNLDRLAEETVALGEMHLAIGVPYHSFEHMWNALDLTLVLVFGIQYNSGVRRTLSNAFQRLVVVMQNCYPPEKRI